LGWGLRVVAEGEKTTTALGENVLGTGCQSFCFQELPGATFTPALLALLYPRINIRE
jgi:hypothetical protein